MGFWKEDISFNLKQERRDQLSTINKVRISLTILSWISLFLTYMFYEVTKPSIFDITFLDVNYGKTTKLIPDMTFFRAALALAIFALLLSSVNVFMMFRYNRRKSDKISYFTIFSLIISLVATILLVLHIF